MLTARVQQRNRMRILSNLSVSQDRSTCPRRWGGRGGVKALYSWSSRAVTGAHICLSMHLGTALLPASDLPTTQSRPEESRVS